MNFSVVLNVSIGQCTKYDAYENFRLYIMIIVHSRHGIGSFQGSAGSSKEGAALLYGALGTTIIIRGETNMARALTNTLYLNDRVTEYNLQKFSA